MQKKICLHKEIQSDMYHSWQIKLIRNRMSFITKTASMISVSSINTQLLKMIQQLQKIIQQLQEKLTIKTIKIRELKFFDDTYLKLQSFLMQMKLYLKVNKVRLLREKDKMFIAVIFFKDHALKWFESQIDIYLEEIKKNFKNIDQNIIYLFNHYDNFKKRLRNIFEEIDATCAAEQKL